MYYLLIRALKVHIAGYFSHAILSLSSLTFILPKGHKEGKKSKQEIKTVGTWRQLKKAMNVPILQLALASLSTGSNQELTHHSQTNLI